VLEALQQRTINKFADAQAGNYASIFLGLSKKATRSLMKRFPDKRLDQLSRNILSRTDEYNKKQFYSAAEKAIGVNVAQAVASEGLSTTRNALFLETSQWAKKLRDETLELYTAQSLRAMSLGKSIDEIMSEFTGMHKKRRDHAKFTARNQVANYNSMVTKARAQKLGISEALWITSMDERVRPCHQVRHGKKFLLSTGLYSSCDGKTLLPGVDYQCRCTYEMIIPEESGDE
jgi:SPP1 gp7 family putative phage head morphogenesis protein